KDSMHDWGEIYFEPYGWVPMDVTYGCRETDDVILKWFYLNGMDSYRLIFNDAYSQNFYPVKIYPRSETVDSQRGEVEWKGGNLYFDKWDWNFEWKVIY
ncbi:MAG: transglutaminase domain-containing protein, partial [Candidatus Marinimicrobia bacterium]|nr:transglutaminase domain-containing protein [Candidatus Neomarinimicrobiota bacterium]